MNRNVFIKIWNSLEHDETTNYEIKDTDTLFECGNYLFIVEEKGNVILKKYQSISKLTLKAVFLQFRNFLILKKIKFIRVEGNKKRYFFLKKMFCNLATIIKDLEETEKNVFYIKVF